MTAPGEVIIQRDRGVGMAEEERRGPAPLPLADVLADLFATRGYARIQATGELETAWDEAVGEPGRRHTRVGGLRRGVLSVVVAHPILLEELAAFQKPALLAALRRRLPGTLIHDIRFRIGPIGREHDREPDPAPPKPSTPPPRPKRRRA